MLLYWGIVMSSYKAHALAGIVMALPFIPSFFYLFFAIIGASIPDMDHKHNKNKVHVMFLVGIIVSLLLILVNGSVMPGVIIIFLSCVFYFSKHRGFTHSFVGGSMICVLLLFMMMAFLPVISSVASYTGYALPNNLSIFVILVLLGFFVVSRRVLVYYILLLAVLLFVTPINVAVIDWGIVFAMLFVGVVSHLFLDLLTPSGLAVLWPLNNVVYHKSFAYVIFVLWVVALVLYVSVYGHIFQSFGFLLSYF